MNETEDTFISHLIEMRDRLLRAVVAVVVLFVLLFPWAQDIYALLAKPMLAALPAGGQMIATGFTRWMRLSCPLPQPASAGF